MKKTDYVYLLVLLVLSTMVLSACGGAFSAQAARLNDLNQNGLAGTVRPTEPTEIHVTGTPESHNGGETETSDIATEKLEPSGTPEVSGTPEAYGTPGADNSHEVLGVVSAVNANSITVNGVTYDFTSLSVIHGTIQVGETVRLTFGNSNGTLIVHEVKVADTNGIGNGQGNIGNFEDGGIAPIGTLSVEDNIHSFRTGGGRSDTNGSSGNGSGQDTGSGH